MALVKPFRALRYDEAVAGPLDELVAPPYDVISAEAVAAMAAGNDHNIVRLIRPHEPDLAAERLDAWRHSGALVRDDKPALWRLSEDFVGPDGVERTRTGVVARVALEGVGGRSILPHERTFDGPLESRLSLLRAVETKLSPILVLHAGPPPPPAVGEAALQATLGDTTTRLWRIDDPADVAATAAAIEPPLVIADGHHRFAAALRYHEERGTEETAHVLSVLVSASDPGLEIFAAHRLASEAPTLNGSLDLTRADSVEDGLARLRALDREHAAFVLVERDRVALVEAAEAADPLARLDVSAVDPLITGDVRFTPSIDVATSAVRDGEAAAAFLVRAPTVDEVQDIARAGLVMPQKSTYFYPKLLSGLLLSPLDE